MALQREDDEQPRIRQTRKQNPRGGGHVGRVDPSVTAALLHEQGYDVVGVTLQLYDYGAALAKKGACCAGQDIYDARRVAESLGFPHYVLNYENNFKESVIDGFVESLSARRNAHSVRALQPDRQIHVTSSNRA